jgi:hypothetical protein
MDAHTTIFFATIAAGGHPGVARARPLRSGLDLILLLSRP